MTSQFENATLDIQKSEIKDGTMIFLSGRFISENIKQFEIEFYPVFRTVEKGKKLFFNLCSVKSIDSRGISFIVGLYKECLLKNIALVVLASSEVYTILNQIRLDRMVPVQEVV
jgi:anti-anti-sigma factor